jgi:hypothetical protein
MENIDKLKSKYNEFKEKRQAKKDRKADFKYENESARSSATYNIFQVF